jgi:hypothetical protein
VEARQKVLSGERLNDAQGKSGASDPTARKAQGGKLLGIPEFGRFRCEQLFRGENVFRIDRLVRVGLGHEACDLVGTFCADRIRLGHNAPQ